MMCRTTTNGFVDNQDTIAIISPMKILNTVIYTIYSEAHQAHVEYRSSFIRTRKLTCSGAQRMIRSGADDKVPSPNACVCRIETACMQ
jgi:hypothetical protein